MIRQFAILKPIVNCSQSCVSFEHVQLKLSLEYSRISTNVKLGGGQTLFIFTPIWGNDPIGLMFLKWVETTPPTTKTRSIISVFFSKIKSTLTPWRSRFYLCA